MERIEGDGKIPYKKIGGGSLRWGRLLIKPGQIIRLNPKEVPENFKDVLIPQERIREATAPSIPVTKTEYIIKARGKSRSLFDIVTKVGVDEKGEDIFKAINEKALSKQSAEDFLEDLTK